MLIRISFTLLLLLSQVSVYGAEIEVFFGANHTTYDDVPEADHSGASALVKANFYGNADKGPFVNVHWRGGNIGLYEAFAGYGIRSKGDWFFEAGAAIAHSPIFGFGFGILAGTGVNLSSKFFVNFPAMYRGGGFDYLLWSPYIGYRF